MMNMVDFFKTKFDAGPERARMDTLFVDVSKELRELKKTDLSI